MKILVSDPLGKGGMDILRREKSFTIDEKAGLKPEELKKIIGQYDAVLIRSGTKLTKELLQAAKKLKVIGRAGVGVDNVDVETATQMGIVVMNTPEGNTISTAEHTFSMLMAVARNIPQADASVKAGEWKRQQFMGTELKDKTLGVIGFGRIGREVAKRALAFNMKILAYDPFISAGAFQEIPAEFVDVNTILKNADFITVHTPLTKETKHLINSETIKLCKKTVRLVNCARGGIIEEKALFNALKTGQVAAAAFDVFEEEPPVNNPLLKLPNFIATPHLGAATTEAQENVAVDVVKQVIDALTGREIRNAVNQPNLDSETLKNLKPWINLAEKMGLLFTQLFSGSFKNVTIRFGGDPGKYKPTAMTISLLKGMLSPICGDTVNFVNAPTVAKERGISVTESRSDEKTDFTSYIEVEVECGKEKNTIMGTLFEGMARVVKINEFQVDVEPNGTILFIKNEDRPGVVGKVGTLLGTSKVNIAEMSLGRIRQGKKTLAMTIINTDGEIPEKVIKQIEAFDPVIDVKVTRL